MHRAWNMDKTDKVGWHYVYQKILWGI
jgi:hypothetical protein